MEQFEPVFRDARMGFILDEEHTEMLMRCAIYVDQEPLEFLNLSLETMYRKITE